MKIAIISDIHGNKLALDEVLKNIHDNGCKKIFCLGDIAMAGYDPNYTIEKIKDLKKSMGENFIIIQGNTDKMIANYSDAIFNKILEPAPHMAYALKEDVKIIKKENVEFLKNLPEQIYADIYGIKIQLVHGSPRRQDENIHPNLKPQEVEQIVASSNAQIILCGHTHLPCGYSLDNGKQVVNVGSVGRSMIPEKIPVYVIMEISPDGSYQIEHKFVQYDNIEASSKILNRGFEHAKELADMLLVK